MKKGKNKEETDMIINVYLESVYEEVEEESCAPLPWQHYMWKRLDRIERMLKYLVMLQCGTKNMAWIEKMGESGLKLPDISDIIEENE